jgi:hypothetical protein
VTNNEIHACAKSLQDVEDSTGKDCQVKLYYRKVKLVYLDYREVLETNTLLAWCDETGRHLGYEGENFEAEERRILDALCEPGASDHIQIAQMPKVTRKCNLNPHGLV